VLRATPWLNFNTIIIMKNNVLISILFLLIICFLSSGCEKNLRLFAGGFTKGDQKGLSVFDFNPRTGKLDLLSEIDAGPSPSYFCFSNRNKMIYAINEVMEFKGQFGGGLTTLKYDPESNKCEKIKEMLIPYAGPCFISMSADSGHLFVANYPNGSVAVVRLDKNGIPESITDTLLYVKEEPDRSHAHMILHDPGGKYVYVTDLGLDRIVIYDFDRTTGKLNQRENGIVEVDKKSGPRHFVFNEDGSILYLINELGSTIMVFRIIDGEGLKLVQTVPTTRQGFQGNNYCADIHIGKEGKFLYGSNRGENSIVVFKISENGLLNLAGHFDCGGNWPRNFVIDPSGKLLLVGNQKSDKITVFRLDRPAGIPSGIADSVKVSGISCLKF
jgi:6-phosphogluconolactonase